MLWIAVEALIVVALLAGVLVWVFLPDFKRKKRDAENNAALFGKAACRGEKEREK